MKKFPAGNWFNLLESVIISAIIWDFSLCYVHLFMALDINELFFLSLLKPYS